MLARCLDSLPKQAIADQIAVLLVVVDNNPAGSARLNAAQFCAEAPFPVYYVHEPVRGIAGARNAALDNALELGSDWIAFIDDDETTDADWLAVLMAPEYHILPILGGQHLQLSRAAALLDDSASQQKAPSASCGMRAVGTGNIRIDAAVARESAFAHPARCAR
jgi:glycosyltransferase involved in cell wall biosynthesis